MKIVGLIRIVSILSYSFIILKGQMIGIPFICWIVFTLFDFGNIDQLFAVLAMLGIILNLTKWKSKVPIAILSFMMMLLPIISRMLQIPVEMFNYLSFTIPFSVFVICYLILIILCAKKEKPVVSL